MFLILSVHELAHMFIAFLFHYRVSEVTIYPFGFSATIPDIGYGSIITEIMIIVAGPLSQTIFPFLFTMLVKWGIISASFASYLQMINANILIFNLLPIYPLDGGRLLQAFFHSIFTYYRGQQLTCIASLFVLAFLFIAQWIHGAGGLFVQVFLLFQLLLCWKELRMMQLQFYHYRFHHSPILPIIMNKKHDLYRGRYNIIKEKSGWEEEHNWLYKYFGKHEKE